MNKIDKILEYLDNKELSYAEFERTAGISNGYLKNTKARGADISDKILDKVKSKHPKIYAVLFDSEIEKHISEVREHEKSLHNGQADENISRLIKSNSDLAESNKALAFSHAELVLMLKAERNVPSSSLSRVERTNREIVSFLMAFAGIDKESQKSLSDEELIKKIEEMGRDIAAQARKNRENDKSLHGRKGKSERAHES